MSLLDVDVDGPAVFHTIDGHPTILLARNTYEAMRFIAGILKYHPHAICGFTTLPQLTLRVQLSTSPPTNIPDPTPTPPEDNP